MLFLVPLAVVGFSAWKAKQREEQQHRNSATGGSATAGPTAVVSEDTSVPVPTIGTALTTDSLETLSLGGSSSDGDDAVVVEQQAADDLLGGSADNLSVAGDEAIEFVDSIPSTCRSKSTEEDDSMKDKTEEVSDPQGPFHGLLGFIQEQQKLFAEIPNPWRIKSNGDSLTYEVLGHQGKRTPRLSVFDCLPFFFVKISLVSRA